ncbi:DUF3949 domain-containing protein [Rossellomorea sp. SC111]|uniref:DUF3949 domain-containing protein n=1 Tax=Rossellomorea sp. SC111 TaxID=2968985 RepID=UPI00215A7638|nr:DUF3949 domain-containing protein [Rossellomorea sp. SC111]MCR8848200.1 DUF3949 domain-containing protein [Rossellomorea sp. SC111]
MEFTIFLAAFGLYVLVLILLPMQYRFLIALKADEEKNRLKGKKQAEMYDAMNVSELSLHGNMQGNPLFFLANLFASILYRVKHSGDPK